MTVEAVLSARAVVPAIIARIPRHVRRSKTADEWESDIWVQVLNLSATFDPEKVRLGFAEYCLVRVPRRLLAIESRAWKRREAVGFVEASALSGVVSHAGFADWDDPDFADTRHALSWPDRLLLALHVREGLTDGEIAETLGVSDRTVRGRLLEIYRSLQ